MVNRFALNKKKSKGCRTVLFNLFVIEEPLIYFGVCHGTPLTKIWKTRITCMKPSISLLDNSTNEQLLQNLKSKKLNDSLVLVFLEFSCYIQNSIIRQKEPVSEICVVPFSNFVNWITFGPLRIRCLFYIWTALLITVHTFAVVVISLHIRKYAILLD